MEAPARGMLRRPVGLLPSVTARAGAAPERMGHVATTVVPVEPAHAISTPTSMVAASPLVAEVGGGIPRAMALPMAINRAYQHAANRRRAASSGTGQCDRGGAGIVAVGHFGEASIDRKLWHDGERRDDDRFDGVAIGKDCCRESQDTGAQAGHSLEVRVLPSHDAEGRGAEVHTACGQTQPETSQLAISEREEARAASRTNTKKGRRRNGKRGANVPQHSLSVAPVSAFEREWQVQLAEKKQRVEHETEELAMERCGLSYVDTEDARAAVMESFLQVCLAEVNRQ